MRNHQIKLKNIEKQIMEDQNLSVNKKKAASRTKLFSPTYKKRKQQAPSCDEMNPSKTNLSNASSKNNSIEQPSDRRARRERVGGESLPHLDRAFSLEVDGADSNCIFN